MKKFIYTIFFLVAKFGFSQDYLLPKYEKFQLKNGLTVYLMEQKEVPIISFSAIIPAGAIYDNQMSGLANLTASSLMFGTKSFTRKQIDEKLDFLGASMSTYASKEFAGLSSKFASKDKAEVLKIINEVLTSPKFESVEIEKEKKQVIQLLDKQQENPRALISSYFDKFIYGSHVYGNVVQGKKSTINNINQSLISDFYNQNYQANGSAISIVGDFNTAEMKKMITDIFSNWKKADGNKSNKASESITPITSNRVLLVNKEDARETTFYIGGAGITRNNPDYIAVDVINTLFGGRFTSMLNDELRVNSGLTYGANSRFSSLKNAGTFYISTFTANKTTEAAINKALEVLNNLHQKGIDEKALASAKNYVKGQFPPKYETASQLSGLLTQMFWYNFDEKFINNFQKNVDSLTLDKAKEIIKKYFPKDKLQFVLIGKSSETKKIAEKLGVVTEVQIKEEMK